MNRMCPNRTVTKDPKFVFLYISLNKKRTNVSHIKLGSHAVIQVNKQEVNSKNKLNFLCFLNIFPNICSNIYK